MENPTKRTGRAGTAPTGEELAHFAAPKRVRCARVPQRNLCGWALLASALWAQTPPAKAIHEGVAIEFDSAATQPAPPPGSRSDVRLRFRVSDTASGIPLLGLRPAAWLDLRRPGRTTDATGCSKKVASFLGGGLLSVPSVDLNAWYVLAMNENATISVVNPRFGFGGSQLLALVILDSPGEDWALTANQQHLFVSMPASGSVAVVDTVSWKVTVRLTVPGRPRRLAVQPGDKYLWVTSDKEAVAFDRETLQLAGRIPLGDGPHEIAFSSDGRSAFVINGDSQTVTVIDTASRRKIADVPLGARSSSLASSPLSRLVYVAHEGGIAALNTAGEIVARMPAEPGIRQLRAAPGGRFLFAVNPGNGQLHIVDTSSNQIVQTSTLHGGPEQVTFSNTLAYIRRRADATVLMIPLEKIGVAGAPLPLVEFAGGRLPFSKGALPSPADSIVQAPGSNAVLVANPADRAVYYYQEGMAAPMGHFANYGHEPRAVMAVDRGLEEAPGGLYQSTGRVPKAGIYDVVFFLDSPRVIHCFEMEVKAADGEAPGLRPVMVRSVELNGTEKGLVAGGPARVRFQVLDARTQQPIANLNDLRVLVFLQPGVWQTRRLAAEAAPGVYALQFTPPSSGVYQAYFDCPSLGLKFNSPHVLTFVASAAPGQPAAAVRSPKRETTPRF